MTTLDERPPTAAPAELLRSTLRRHASGVVVITVPGPAGFTATSFTSVSLEPALVSFYLASGASTAPAVRAAEAFTVHVLRREQEELARAFARSGADRFAGVPWHEGPHGTPLLEGAAARLTARRVGLHPVGDHLLVVGEVVAADVPGGEPLVHHDGGFGGFAPGAGEGPWR
ncbi:MULTISPECIES: flavin reductase family protein [unclassified Kitasatospora]|uniref:flavin reductase family protein n=1 Tax=unclassified Kitasatospora TaxID=2633591 RepID=UPI000C2BB3F9|nr:flavin reductase family protein [Kitasatospora sp. SolWspMP-SS2h]RAJ47194.1 flavin reductase (DIM6/NTAB) family NADH-FMN oxidoreductase RutF [Kitasatospora sp. SolWspMP-SS2h]